MRLAWRTVSLLTLAATLPLAWLLLAQPAPGNLPQPTRAPQPVRAEDRPAPHPLDPLSREEFARAARALTADRRLPSGAFLPILTLHEPSKEEVLNFKTGQEIRRQAFAVILDRPAGKTYEAIIDLKEGKIVAWVEKPGVQPAILYDEFRSVIAILEAHPQVKEALKKRKIPEGSKIQFDTWAPGYLPPVNGKPVPRTLYVLCYLRGNSNNPMARPIEGLVIVYDLRANKVVEIRDSGFVPVPEDSGDFFNEKYRGPNRPALKPLEIRQPKGVSFTARGNAISWDRWSFRWSLHPREGLVLHTVSYRDGNRDRSVLHRGSLSEMAVPYADPAGNWNWRCAFDQGEYGVGTLSNPLRRGKEVPENAQLFDVLFADEFGAVSERKGVVAVWEQDGGILWSHSDFGTPNVETRRARQLVIANLFTVGNYDYGMQWIFHQDGVLECRLELTGVMLTKAVDAKKCAGCVQEPDADGKIRSRGADRHGTLVSPNLVATLHQHFFNFRLDLDIDGVKNSVQEHELQAAPQGADNPLGNAFLLVKTPLRTERTARRSANEAAHRVWKVFNPRSSNSLGHQAGYVLEPGPLGKLYSPPATVLARRMAFARHSFWATHYRPGETNAAGYYPNQADGSDGLMRWTEDNESLEEQDLVIWHTVGLSHVPRPEEWPVMPVTRTGFRLVPSGFFSRNPALDVP